MELNFFYLYKNRGGKIVLTAEELDYIVNYSEINRYRPTAADPSCFGWLPIQNGGLRQTLPRYYGTVTHKATYNSLPSSLVSKIRNKFSGQNTYSLDRGANFIEKNELNQYTGIDLYVQGDEGKKKVCKFQWAVVEEDDPQHPGQKILSSYFNGLYNFACPEDDFPNSSVGTLSNLSGVQGKYSADLKIALWIITVHDDVSGSPSYGQDFKVLVETFSHPEGFVEQGVIMADMRCLTGVDTPSNIINGSEPKKNSTPKGWSGTRNTASGRDFPTMCPDAVKNSVNFGDHGIFLYECETSDIEEISGFLWDTDIILVNWEPVKGILAIHKLPYIPEHMDGSEPEDKVNVNIAGKSVIANGLHYVLNPLIPEPGGDVGGVSWEMTHYEPMGWKLYGGQEKTSQPLQVQPFFGSFLDFEPYTKVQVRLPFIGTVSVPTSACMGGWIKVNYIFDNRNGNCVAQILCESMRNGENDDSDGYIIIGQYSGNCAIPAAITGNSTGGEARIGAVKGFASSAASIGAGVALGVASPVAGAAALIGAGVKGAIDYASAPKTPDIIGSVNCEAACLEDLAVKVIITRPVDVTPGEYQIVNGERVFTASSLMDQKGLASYAGGVVNQYEGMTIGYIRGTIEGASEAEMLEIRNMFLGGVIV